MKDRLSPCRFKSGLTAQSNKADIQHNINFPPKVLDFAAFPFDFDANVSIAVVIEAQSMLAVTDPHG